VINERTHWLSLVHGPGVDDPIAMERGGESYFYHTDQMQMGSNLHY